MRQFLRCAGHWQFRSMGINHKSRALSHYLCACDYVGSADDLCIRHIRKI